MVFWYGAMAKGVGSHTRVTPRGCSTRTVVVISNTRQRGDASACANTAAWSWRASAAAVIPVRWRKTRRFISAPDPIVRWFDVRGWSIVAAPRSPAKGLHLAALPLGFEALFFGGAFGFRRPPRLGTL